MAITKEQVFQAADELVAEGLKPTMEAVRQRVGGSYTTIGPALKAWKEKQTAVSPAIEAMPAELAGKVSALMNEVWTTAMSMATARLQVERDALEKARAELEEERQEATQLADRYAEELDALKARLTQIEAAEKGARAEVVAVKTELALAVEKGRQLDSVQEQAAADRKVAAVARERADRYADELEAMKKRTAQVEAAEKEARSEAVMLKTELALAAEKGRQLESVQEQAAADRNAAAMAREQAATLEGQVLAMNEQLKQLMQRIGTPGRAKRADSKRVVG
ncbi:MAG: DNA-binding protein [Lautropia sp.]|nr:DNA-binding protein [Lautropia sp.]